jgi:predicted Zn-ribbon and HTH transcriptional regulator
MTSIDWARLPCPSQKNFYPTRAAAIVDRNLLGKVSGRSRNANGDRLKLRPYRCRRCGGWHLTSQPKRSR